MTVREDSGDAQRGPGLSDFLVGGAWRSENA